MTADDKQTLREDIAFMKALASEGISTPLVGGPILMLFGGVFGALNLISWLTRHFWTMSGNQIFWLNTAGMAICVVGLPLLILRLRKQPGIKAPANRAFGVVWAAVGWAIFMMMLVTYLACSIAKSSQPAMLMAPAVFTLYAVGWSVAAAMTRQRFLWLTAIVCYPAAFVPVLVWNDPNNGLWLGLIIFLVAFVPGFVLFLREPKAIV